jgi:DNA-binding NtrC family response regulator
MSSMIAMVAGSAEMRRGPVPVALAHAGFEVRDTSTTDAADCTVGEHGASSCVLIVDAGSLDRRAGSATWSRFLDSHRAVPAVVVTRGEAHPELHAAAREGHRVLLESPFDTAAVVVAARQASSHRRLQLPDARGPLREAG